MYLPPAILRRLTLLAVMIPVGCMSLPDLGHLVDPWGGRLASPRQAIVMVDGHQHADGDPGWVGHHTEELLQTLGEPDFALLTPLNDIAYCYVRPASGAAGTDCIDAYVVNAQRMITAVYCR